MSQKLEYDYPVKGRKHAPVVAFAALLIALASAATAQINGAPPSVTSLGFGGRAINGTPPSVTSLGPSGATFNPAFPNSRPVFNVNPFLPPTGQHHHRRPAVVPWGTGYYYAAPYGYYDSGDDAADDPPADPRASGLTVFDHRASGPPTAPQPMDYADRGPASAVPDPEPAADQPQTILVFKDGRQMEVENYAIVGNTLYDLTQGRRHRIPLSDLDLDATTKQNSDRGIDFQVPSGS